MRKLVWKDEYRCFSIYINVQNAVLCQKGSLKRWKIASFARNEYIMQVHAYIKNKWLNQKLSIHFRISFENRELQRNTHKQNQAKHRLQTMIAPLLSLNVTVCTLLFTWSGFSFHCSMFSQLTSPHIKSMYLLKIAQLLKWYENPHVRDFQAVSFYCMCYCTLFADNTSQTNIGILFY